MNIKSAHFLPGTNKRLGDKYLLLECLGDGSHGWVWRAERLKDGKIVAVKIPKDITREDRQLAEGKELLNVEPHENIVQIFDMGRIDNEWFYIEMEYFPSQTLAQKLDDRQRNFTRPMNGCSEYIVKCSVLCIIWPNYQYQYLMEILSHITFWLESGTW